MVTDGLRAADLSVLDYSPPSNASLTVTFESDEVLSRLKLARTVT